MLAGKALLEKSIIHTTSNQEQTEIKQFIKAKKIYVIPNILELPERIYGKPLDEGLLKLIFIGRIDPAKNIEMLLHVLTSKVKIPYQLNIVGEGPHEYVNELKITTRDHHNIFWTGNKDGDEKFKMIAEADLLLLPSLTENFGNVIFESLSQGTAVLISSNVGAKDFIVENQLGWVIEIDEDSLASAINNIWDHKADLSRIRKTAPAIITHHFDPRMLVKEYVSMYSNVIE